MRVAIAGGITGGHLFPALCVGEALQREGASVLYLGAQHGLEARIALPFPALLLDMSHLRPAARVPWRLPFTLLRLCAEARRALDRFDAELLFCTGGYSALPIAFAQRSRRKPMVLLEPDARPGRANRYLARFAARIAINFEEAAAHFPRGKTVRTGLPVRLEVCRPDVPVATARESFGLALARFTVLVIGGSQGAQSLNEAVLNTVQYMPATSIQWLHITGEAHYEMVRATADRLALNGNYHPLPFLSAEKMGLAYRAADVAVARGGAGTITELALNGLPAVLIPYPFAASAHQRYNCEAMVQRGAALMIEQSALSPSLLAQMLTALHECPQQREEMRQRARQWAIPDATQRVLQIIRDTLVDWASHPARPR